MNEKKHQGRYKIFHLLMASEHRTAKHTLAEDSSSISAESQIASYIQEVKMDRSILPYLWNLWRTDSHNLKKLDKVLSVG